MFFPRLLCLFLCILMINQMALGCTRLLRMDQPAVMTARTMDWDNEMRTQLWIYPRGRQHQGSEDAYPLQWTSKYGSIAATAYDQITTDGFNEQGLAAHILWLSEADYGKRSEKLPGLLVTQWAQFYLDNFKTVDEAVRFTELFPFQLLPFYQQETHEWVKLHLALEDVSGDSAIIEYISGKPVIYHNKDDIVLTNSPVYNEQLKNLELYEGPKSLPLPGTQSPKDRFVRAAYHTVRLPHANSAKTELTDVLAVIRNVSSPKKMGPKTSSWTQWRSISDLSHKIYYFDDTAKLGLIWVPLNNFNVLPGSPLMKLDLSKDNNYSGDVSKLFQPVYGQHDAANR